MGRIAVSEDVEGIREEEDVGDEVERKTGEDGTMGLGESSRSPTPKKEAPKGKYVATLTEVQDAFDSINTLRYSQPTHLQGNAYASLIYCLN